MKASAIMLVLLLAAPSARAARCTGSANCTACKTCSSCAHCAKQGGTCGVSSRWVGKTPGSPAARRQDRGSSPVGWALVGAGVGAAAVFAVYKARGGRRNGG